MLHWGVEWWWLLTGKTYRLKVIVTVTAFFPTFCIIRVWVILLEMLFERRLLLSCVLLRFDLTRYKHFKIRKRDLENDDIILTYFILNTTRLSGRRQRLSLRRRCCNYAIAKWWRMLQWLLLPVEALFVRQALGEFPVPWLLCNRCLLKWRRSTSSLAREDIWVDDVSTILMIAPWFEGVWSVTWWNVFWWWELRKRTWY